MFVGDEKRVAKDVVNSGRSGRRARSGVRRRGVRRKWGKRTAGAKERKFRDENGMVRCDERQRQLETFTAVHLESKGKQDRC